MKSGSFLHDLIDQGKWDELHEVLSSSKNEGIDVNYRDERRCSSVLQLVLSSAPTRIVLALVALLLKLKADVNARNCKGDSPLHTAFSFSGRRLECIRLLLAHGADANIVNNYKSSPLSNALYDTDGEAALLLINNGANMRQRNIFDETLLDKALFSIGMAQPNATFMTCVEILYDAYPVVTRKGPLPPWFLSIKRKRTRFRQTALCVLGVLRHRLGVSRDMVWLIGQLLRSTRFISNWDESQ